jgi:hypothetical protein
MKLAWHVLFVLGRMYRSDPSAGCGIESKLKVT